MSLLKKASIITTPTAYAEDYLYSIKPAYALGSELVTNGNFYTNSDWILSQATITNNQLVVTGGANFLRQTGVAVSGKKYQVKINIASQTSFLRLRITFLSGNAENEFVPVVGDNIINAVADGTEFRLEADGAIYTGVINSVSLKEITDADFDFTRNSTGSRVNEDYLIEDVPYNLLSYTEELTNAYWDKVSVTVTGGFQDPFYGNNAFKVVDTSGGGTAYLHEPNIAEENYGRSIYARTVSGTGTVSLLSYFGNTNNDFTLTEKWQRFYVNSSTTSTGASNFYAVDFRDGDLTEVLLYAPQLTKSPTLKDYLKTTDRLDIPRIDYTNGEPSILLEPSRTNEVEYSNDIGSISGLSAIGSSIITNNISSPEGLTGVSLLKENSASSSHFIFKDFSLTNPATYTISLFAKSNGGRNLRLGDGSLGWSSGFNANFDLTTGTSDSGTMVNYGNGWYRCSVQGTTNAATSRLIIYSTDGTTTSYQGDNASGVNLYGLQIEQGSYATSLIHTSGSAVTRSQDSANNAGNSDLFNDSEGVLYAEIKKDTNNLDGSFGMISIGNANNNRVQLNLTNNSNNFDALVGSSSGTNNISSAFNFGVYNKIALSYNSSGFKVFHDGTLVGSDSNTISGLNLQELKFEFASSASHRFEGNAKSVMVFKEALTDLELEKLTGYNNHELYMNYYNRLSYLGLVEEYNVESDINNYIL